MTPRQGAHSCQYTADTGCLAGLPVCSIRAHAGVCESPPPAAPASQQRMVACMRAHLVQAALAALTLRPQRPERRLQLVHRRQRARIDLRLLITQHVQLYISCAL